jgi:DNA-binding response OmpR family regulator
LSRDTILLRVWGMDSQVEERNIDNFVYLVRRRLKNVGSTLRLSAVRGFGYRLEVE